MIYLAAILIPVIIYILLMFMTGVYPFGDNALLISDINNQFVAFYTYFKHSLEGSENLIYTLSKSLGGDMIGFSGYYLRNPFLFILLFFRDEYIPFGIVIITGMSLACMSLTMAILLKNLQVLRRDDRGYGIVLFSLSYAFMGYSMAYISLPIYFTDLILLPLIILGLKKLFEGRKLLYIITLFLAIFCNYYIGYMICIFCSLCFLVYLTETEKSARKSHAIDFVVSSLIAGGLSAFATVPAVLSLRGQKEAPSLANMKPEVSYGIRPLVRNLFAGGFRGDLSNYSAPYIYVGEIALAFVFVFFVSKRIKIKTKLCAALFLLLMLAGTYISTADVIWHGFNAPVGFAHRQAFLICFSLILIGYIGYAKWSDTITVSWLIPAAALLVQIILLMVNAYISLDSYEQHSLSEYMAYYTRTQPLISGIKTEDGDLYRLEKDYEYNHNDAMLFSYNGLTHNSSCDKDYAKEFLGKMGIRYYAPIWTFYNQGSTAFADCFLGVRYFISRFDETNKPYIFIRKAEGVNENGDERTAYVFRNPYAMPLCFGMKQAQLDTDMNRTDLFAIQNDMAGMDIYSQAAPVTKDIDTDEDISIDVIMSKSCNLYFYAAAPDYQGAELLVDDYSYEDYFSVSRWNIVNLGYHNEGDIVNVKLRPTQGNIRVDEVFIYEEDTNAIAAWYEKEQKEAGRLKMISGSHLTGKMSTQDSDRVVFTIPYEKGWNVWVDGNRVKTDKALGALLSIEAQDGDHDIDMKYVCEGTYAGIIISVLSLAALCIYLVRPKGKSTLG